ncbi:MAG: hypothetical protein WHT47_03765 [Hydrogenothermaceae bacterium]
MSTYVFVLVAFFLITTVNSYAGPFDNIKNLFQTDNSLDCNSMLENSPKKTTTESYLKYAIGGLAVGAAAGAVIDKDNRMGGAVIGGIGGFLAGMAVGRVANDKLIAKPRNDILKTAKPPFFKLINIEVLNSSFETQRKFKPGEYVLIFIKVQGVENSEEEGIDIGYLLHVYKDDQYIGTLKDSIILPQGEVHDFIAIPICKSIPPGKYRVDFNVINNSISEKKVLEWEVIQ